MNNTRENVLTLLKEMKENSYTVSEVFREQGNELMDERAMAQYGAYDSVIRLLTDKEFFNKIWEIYKGAEK